MRVLVTGSSGHVGGAIARHLAGKGWDVVGLSRGRTAQLPDSVEQVCSDISALSFLDDVSARVAPCEAIVHAAAALDMGLCTTAVSLTNCLGTQQVLALAQRWGVGRFAYTSSAPVIGRPRSVPITEEHSTHPLTAYHASKLYGEHLVAVAGTGAALRVSSPVGPGMPGGRILSIFVRRALAGDPLVVHGRGTRAQNYVDVRDISVLAELCLDSGAAGIFNAGGRTAISNYDLAQTCVRVLNSPSPVALSGEPDPDDDVAWGLSTAKAEEVLGFVPQYSVEDSIRAVARELGWQGDDGRPREDHG